MFPARHLCFIIPVVLVSAPFKRLSTFGAHIHLYITAVFLITVLLHVFMGPIAVNTVVTEYLEKGNEEYLIGPTNAAHIQLFYKFVENLFIVEYICQGLFHRFYLDVFLFPSLYLNYK